MLFNKLRIADVVTLSSCIQIQIYSAFRFILGLFTQQMSRIYDLPLTEKLYFLATIFFKKWSVHPEDSQGRLSWGRKRRYTQWLHSPPKAGVTPSESDVALQRMHQIQHLSLAPNVSNSALENAHYWPNRFRFHLLRRNLLSSENECDRESDSS